MYKYDRELFDDIASRLIAFGFIVYRAERGTYGFYTDTSGARVVSFQTTDGRINFGGNYAAGSRDCGTGWQIAENAPKDATVARGWLNMLAPAWACKRPQTYATVATHLANYQSSSKFERVST